MKQRHRFTVKNDLELSMLKQSLFLMLTTFKDEDKDFLKRMTLIDMFHRLKDERLRK